MTEYNFVMIIISIVMVIFFVFAWVVSEEKRRNKAANKYATANPQLHDDIINKIIQSRHVRRTSHKLVGNTIAANIQKAADKN